MKPTRILVTLAALAVGTWAMDVGLGRWLLARSGHADLPLPPFGQLEDRDRAELEKQLAAARAGVPSSPVQGFDAELGWCNRPGRSGPRGVTIGGLGSRGEGRYKVTPPPGVLRLACFGTSFIFGTEVEDEEAWSAQLEGLDENLEVLNFGVGGYGTDQALLRMRREGLRGARVAVLGLCLENIGRNVNRYRSVYSPTEGHGVMAKPRFLLKDGELVLLSQPYEDREEMLVDALEGRLPAALAEHDYWAGDDPIFPGSLIARVLAAGTAHRRRTTHSLWLRPDEEPYQVTLALLQAFHDEALALGAERALVLVFARRMDLDSFRGHGHRYWKGLLEDLDERGVSYLDLATRFVEEDTEEVFRQVHLSPEGNAIVAEEVSTWLKENGAVAPRGG